MVRRLARAFSLVRDVAFAILSFTIISSQYSRLGQEESFFVTISISIVILALCFVDVVLVLLNRGRGVMNGIAALDLALGVFWLLLFPPVGLLVLVASAAVLVTLREKKTAEELLKHPPVPKTRNYLLTTAAGTLLLVLSIFLPWFSSQETSISFIDVYRAIATHSGGLPSVSFTTSQTLLALLAVFLSPVAVLCGALAFRWRRFSFVSGVLSAALGAGLVIALGSSAGVGGYVLLIGGVVTLIGFVAFRGASKDKPVPR